MAISFTVIHSVDFTLMESLMYRLPEHSRTEGARRPFGTAPGALPHIHGGQHMAGGRAPPGILPDGG